MTQPRPGLEHICIPDRNRFIDPHRVPILEGYLRNVVQWHGYIQFVSVTSVRENPDVPIAQLYVEPYLATQWVSPDTPEGGWPETKILTKAAIDHPRLVVLGDPGSGKSTLVSWLSWQLARHKDSPWVPELDGLVPLPMVLRELDVRPGITWDGLLDSFLRHVMAKPLVEDRKSLEQVLASGQAYVLLDGLDELGSLEARRSLRDAVFDGMERHPACRWLLTSRIVGYDEAAFHRTEVKVSDVADWPWEEEWEWEMHRHPLGPNFWHPWNKFRRPLSVQYTIQQAVAHLAYVAPFNDEQIRRYAHNWFAQRDLVSERAAAHGEDFIRAIYGNETVIRLARTPYILALMALIYRVKAKLPHGRALLYQQISEAYLQTIDEYRRLRELGYPLAQKRRWLARTGFEMQVRRSRPQQEPLQVPEGDAETLASEMELVGWIAEAMGESGYGRDELAAKEFVDYIARRSGLLLPRGPGQFAFAHLSFQEYFAACYLAEQLRSPFWPRTGRTPDARIHQGLRSFADDVLWRETLIFLFEIVADEPGWSEAVADAIFGTEFKELAERWDATVLLATLSVDPHSGFSKAMRDRAMEQCWRAELENQCSLDLHAWAFWVPKVAVVLLSALPGELPGVWGAFEAASGGGTKHLTLSGACVTDPTPLEKLTNLEWLDLSGTFVSDPTPLKKLAYLEVLNLSSTSVSDFMSLTELKKLNTLDARGTPISNRDLMHLKKLTHLRALHVGGTHVNDLTALENLTSLTKLGLAGTRVSYFPSLEKLSNLEWLDLSDTLVSDLTPLEKLTNLTVLYLSRTPVGDLMPLAKLAKLRSVEITGTKVANAQIERFRNARQAAGLEEVVIDQYGGRDK